MLIRGEGLLKRFASHNAYKRKLIFRSNSEEDLIVEKWVILNEPYDKYAVSDLGQIKNIKTGKILAQHLRPNDGYLQVTLWNNNKGKNFTVHRLVALNFLDNTEKKRDVNHKNGIKTDNRLENLEWCTPSENNYHAVHMRLVNTIPVKIVDLIDNKEYNFDSISQAAAYFNIDARNLSRALKRKNQVYSHFKITKI